MAKAQVEAGAPTTVNSSVRKTRKYLTLAEVERLMAAARKSGRYGHRDATMILIAFRHGLRAFELCDLQWHQVELAAGRLHVRRVKSGTPSVHPLHGDELRALLRPRRERPRRRAAEQRDEFAAVHSTRLPFLRTSCCGTRAVTPWPTLATTLAHCRLTSGTRTFSTRCATPSCRRIGSRTSGVDAAGGQSKRRARIVMVYSITSSARVMKIAGRSRAEHLGGPEVR
jgi:integrase